MEAGQFPTEVNSTAVFRCVRVSGVECAEERCAYQTCVNIGGHVFKGILYDQGPESSYTTSTVVGEGSSAGGGGAKQLGFVTATNTATTSGNPYFDPSLYPAPLNAFMSGTHFSHPQDPKDLSLSVYYTKGFDSFSLDGGVFPV